MDLLNDVLEKEISNKNYGYKLSKTKNDISVLLSTLRVSIVNHENSMLQDWLKITTIEATKNAIPILLSIMKILRFLHWRNGSRSLQLKLKKI